MASKTPTHLRLIAGVCGALLIASLFLPWVDVVGHRQSGWQLNTVLAIYLAIAGLFGIATAITGGQYGIGRADVSLIGATDLLNTTAIVLLAWLIFDYPENATRQAGVYGALVLVTITGLAVADYRPLRGAPWFASIGTGERTDRRSALGGPASSAAGYPADATGTALSMCTDAAKSLFHGKVSR